MSDLFISYSRKNMNFAMQLRKALGTYRSNDDPTQEIDFWIDIEDIEYSTDWWKRIVKGIEETNNFVVLVSSDYLASDVCHAELKYAFENNKHIIPVILEPIDEKITKEKLDLREWKLEDKSLVQQQWQKLRRINYIDHSVLDFNKTFLAIMKAVSTDVEYKDYHSELNRRALQWHRSSREDSYLLSGEQLTISEDWLNHAIDKEPSATYLQSEYIHSSRKLSLQKQRQQVYALSLSVILLLTLTVISVFFGQRAQRNSQIAMNNAATAEYNEVLSEVYSEAVSLFFSESCVRDRDEVGNATLRLNYPQTVRYPETFVIEAEIVFDQLFVTPTPIVLTTIAFSDISIPEAIPIQYEEQPQLAHLSIPSQQLTNAMGFMLRGDTSEFVGIEEGTFAGRLIQVNLTGVNSWRWTVQPTEGTEGLQFLSLIMLDETSRPECQFLDVMPIPIFVEK